MRRKEWLRIIHVFSLGRTGSQSLVLVTKIGRRGRRADLSEGQRGQ